MLVILFTTSLRLGAAENFEVRISENQLLLVEFENVEPGSILSFQDISGEILFRDSLLPNEPYRKTLNLELVPEGVYHLNLNMENSITTTMITKGKNGLEITGENSKTIFQPLYKIEGKTVKIFLTNPEMKKANFSIYDSREALVTTISFSDQTIRKTLDFSRIPAGEYTINVQLENRYFDRKIRIE